MPNQRYLSLLLVPLLSLPALAAQSPAVGSQPQSSDVEEIQITGRQSRISLGIEIKEAEQRMFNVFNELNDVDQFEITCETIMVTGSRIAERECVPRYLKLARLNASENWVLSDMTSPYEPSGPVPVLSTPMGAPKSDEELRVENMHRHAEFNAKFRELASQHPELGAAVLEWQTKQQRLQQMERAAKDKKGGALSRFFSRSGGNDRE